MALEFKIELTGNFAGALEKDAQAAEKAEGATKKHRKELEIFEAEVGHAKAELGGFGLNLEAFAKGGSLFTFDLAEGLKGAVELAGELVEKVVDLGKEILQVAGKTQDINLAIRLNVGDDKAGAINELAESFEKTTRFDAGDIKKALLPLLKQGVSDTETLDAVATIATDLAARNAGGIEDVQQSISAFAGIFQRGRLKPAQLAQFGIQASDYFEQLGKSLGVSKDAAEKMAKQGKVTQDKLAEVAINMVAARQGGAIGGPTLDSAKTLGATLQRLANVKDNLFERLADSPALTKVQGALDHFIDAMNGDVGDQLITGIADAFTEVGNWLEWATSPQGIEVLKGAIDNVTSSVKGMVGWFHDNWDSIKAGAEGLWTVLKEIGKTVGVIVDGWAKLINLSHDFDSGQIGKDITDTLTGEHGGIATGNTPKNMTWDEGTQTWKVNTPKMAVGGIVDRPTLLTAGEAGPEAIVPLDRMGSLGGSMAITYAPVYHASGGNAAELRGELEHFDRQARLEFKRIVDEMLAQ
jgi:tape measure domain-containing protein